MTRPRVTVAIAAYNEEQFLPDALDALLGQDLGDLEVLVGDNGSTDATPRICREYARRDGRVRHLRSETNRGAAWNYNRLVPEARAPYFKWAAGDDLVAPSFLGRCVELLDDSPHAVLCHSRTLDVDAGGQVIGPLDYPWDGGARSVRARFRSALRDPHPCVDVFGVMRTDVLRRTRLQGAYPDADRLFLAEMSLRGTLEQVDEPLFWHREHPRRFVNLVKDRIGRDEWWDPARAGRLTMPSWRYAAEAVRAVATAPLAGRDRAACMVEVASWTRDHRLGLARDVVAAGRLARRRAPYRRGRSAHAPA